MDAHAQDFLDARRKGRSTPQWRESYIIISVARSVVARVGAMSFTLRPAHGAAGSLCFENSIFGDNFEFEIL